MSSYLSVKAATERGRGLYRVGRNLYLAVDAGGSKGARSWVFIYQSRVTGKSRRMGLGSADVVNITRAKELVLRHRLAILEGREPLDERRAARRQERPRTLYFREVAELYIDAHAAAWRNPKHRAQWSSSLQTYAYPVLGDLPIAAIGTGEVMRVLEPIWHDKPATASRVRGRVELVLDFAKARHWRQGDNPARWKGHISNLLPPHAKVKPTKHHPAVPWPQLPALWAELADREDISALGLRLALLTVLRTNEVLGGRWEEIDRPAKVWTVPGERMKLARPFRVPLSTAAITVLDLLATLRRDVHLFPGAKAGRPLGINSMSLVLRPLRPGMTVHGTVRSGFRDWASEHGVAGEVAEECLAHTIKNKVEAAYRRGDLLQPRAATMERWAQFLTTPAEPAVVPMRRRAAE